MPNYVGNSIIVSGPEYEIERLVSYCLHVQETAVWNSILTR